MNRSRAHAWQMALLLMLPTSQVQPIVVRHDRTDHAHRGLATDVPQAVELGERGGAGVATLVRPCWLLTAAHVAQHKSVGDTIMVGGSPRRIDDIVLHPDFSLRPIRHDVALVRLESDVEDVVPARLYDGDEEVGMSVLFVGSGGFGTGLTGPQQRDRVRRAATNRVERADALWISFRFDEPGKADYHEGISGPGDSGGAAFVETDSTLWVIGVSSWQDTAPTGRQQGRYGVFEHYTRVSTHLAWIESVIG